MMLLLYFLGVLLFSWGLGMGVSYPYLAILSTVIFVFIVMSVVSVSLWIIYQASNNPLVEGYSSFEWGSGDTATISIVFRLTRGHMVTFERILLSTNYGVLNISGSGTYVFGNSTFRVSYDGFNGKLFPGQEGKINIEVTNATEAYTSGRTYRSSVFFDGGTLIVSFEP